MKADPAALLLRYRDQLADGWVRSLGRVAPALARRPADELLAAARLICSQFAHAVQRREAGEVRALAEHAAIVGLLRDAELGEVLRALLALREQVLDLLQEQVPEFPNLWRATRHLVEATDALVVDLTVRHRRGRLAPAAVGPVTAEEVALAVGAEVRRALRFRRPLALLLVHTDAYEQTARVYGGAVEGRVVGTLVRILEHATREVDLKLALEDGDHAVLLPETDLVPARAIAERIRLAAEAGEGTDPALAHLTSTVSVGLATFPRHADTAPALLAAAQEALLQARRLGGNTVVVSAEPGAQPSSPKERR